MNMLPGLDFQLGEDIETAVDTMLATDEAAAERIAQAGGLNP